MKFNYFCLFLIICIVNSYHNNFYKIYLNYNRKKCIRKGYSDNINYNVINHKVNHKEESIEFDEVIKKIGSDSFKKCDIIVSQINNSIYKETCNYQRFNLDNLINDNQNLLKNLDIGNDKILINNKTKNI
jgi:mevalonate kinase